MIEDERVDGDDVGGRTRWLIALLGLMLRRPQDTLATGVASAALITILVNALFLQPNPHPAPLFSVKTKARPAATLEATSAVVVLPRPRPADLAAPRVEATAGPAPATRPRSAIITDIQRELSRRGLYDGAVDGIHGSRTEAAIRSFERASGTKVGAEPSEAMVQAITRAPSATTPNGLRRADPIGDLVARTTPPSELMSPVPLAVAAPTPPNASSARSEPKAVPRPTPGEARPLAQSSTAASYAEPRNEPARTEIAALPPPSEPSAPADADKPAPADRPIPRADLPTPRVKAVQRALSEFGYGQLKLTGVVDTATAAAIRDFEEARDLPITGQVSDRMVQELATVTGRPVE